MKNSRIRYLLFGCISLGLLLFFGAFSAHSRESNEKSPVQSPIKVTAPSKPNEMKAMPLKPGEEIPEWRARWELARVLSYVKRYDESIEQYRKLLKEKPGLTEAKLEMAKVSFWKGDQKAAVQILEQLPPKDITGETKVLMADLLVAQKNYARAEPLYKAHLKSHPEDQAVRLKLADMLSWQKKYDASLGEYRKILRAHPDDIQVRRRYAFVLIWAGQHAEAAKELNKSLD